jgi:hypothetical protein
VNLSPRARRIVRSYGLVIAIAVGFLLMVLMVKTVGTAG